MSTVPHGVVTSMDLRGYSARNVHDAGRGQRRVQRPHGLHVVEIIDANGTVTTLRVNGAGNFYSKRSVALPYTARVVSGTKSRVMKTPETNMDCNSCHTEGGTSGAPGRIIAP